MSPLMKKTFAQKKEAREIGPSLVIFNACFHRVLEAKTTRPRLAQTIKMITGAQDQLRSINTDSAHVLMGKLWNLRRIVCLRDQRNEFDLPCSHAKSVEYLQQIEEYVE